MADFTSFILQVNSGASDASPTWSNVSFGTAANELRLCASGAGGASILAANWPPYLRPATGTVVIPECWMYTVDGSGGLKVTTYDGTTAHYMQFRLDWDALGTFASAPIISAWANNTYPAAVPGTQPGVGDGTAPINGQTTDTSNTSYLKANAYGYGIDTGGTQQTPSSNAAGTLTVTSGTAGAVSPATGAWLSNWQSLQAATQYIQDAVIPKATTAGFWYFVLAEYAGSNETGGTLLPVLGVSYSWV